MGNGEEGGREVEERGNVRGGEMEKRREGRGGEGRSLFGDCAM